MSLRKDFASGVLYTSIAKYSGIGIQLIIASILARLLTPEDFGIVAIATVLIQFFNTISEAGIGPAIIQKKELSQKEIESIFTFTILISCFLGGIFFFSSDAISHYYTTPEIKPICQWLSLLILFSGIDVVTNSLLLKQKKFKTIAIRTITVQIVTGVLSIYTAWIGWGTYALVLSAVSSKVLIFIINYFCNPLNLEFKFGCLKKIASYSSYQFCFNIVNYFSRNLDKLIIGKLIGMNQLGYYEKSYRLMMLPLSNLTYVLTPVMHPIFSEMQNEKELMLSKYLKLLTIIGCISFPLMAFLFYNAKDLILLVFGNQWEDSVMPFKILSLTVGLQVLHSTASGIFQAIDDTKGLFWVSFVSAVLMILGFFISGIYFKTIEAIAYSFLITCTLGSFLVFLVLFKRFHKGFLLFIQTIKIPLLLGCLEFLCGGILQKLIYTENMIISLIINTIACLMIIVITVYFTKLVNFKELRHIFK